MVSQALVQQKAAYGYSKAANALAATCSIYRPNGTGNPIVPANIVASVPVLFDTAADMQQRAPSKAEKPTDWYAAFDFAVAQNGDYIVEPTLGTFFIQFIEFFRPVRAVLCNQLLTFTRPSGQAPGSDYYGGDVTAYETPLFGPWPASVINGTKGERGESTMPGDVRLPWYACTLPPSVPVQLRTADMVKDAQGIAMLYTVSGAEVTPAGWRLTLASALP